VGQRSRHGRKWSEWLRQVNGHFVRNGHWMAAVVALMLISDCVNTGIAGASTSVKSTTSSNLATTTSIGQLWSIPYSYYVTPQVGPGGTVTNATADSPQVGAGLSVLDDQTGNAKWFAKTTQEATGDRYNVVASDSSGEAYFAYASANRQAIAEAAGSKGIRWQTSLDPGCLPYGSEALGFNGQFYVGLQCSGSFRLVSLSAQSGSVIFDESVVNPGLVAEIHAYHNGIVAYNGGQVVYLNYDGSIAADYLVNGGAYSGCSTAGAWGTDGSVYFTCSTNPGVTLEKYSPSGPVWAYSWPTTGYLSIPISVAALPNGSAAVAISSTGSPGQGISVVGPSAGNSGVGSIVWSRDYATTHNQFWSIYQVLADANGNVAADFSFIDPSGSVYCPYLYGQCVAYEIDLLDGGTGAIKSSAAIHTGVGPTYSDGTDFDLDSNIVVLGGAVGSQLTMFGASLPGVAPAYPESDFPTVGPAPAVPRIGIGTPNPSDAVLTRALTLTSSVGSSGSPIANYQYGWASGAGSAVAPATKLQKCRANTQCRLSYAATTPNSTWTLFARAIDASGARSGWSSTVIQTPKAPILIALGDSVTSGHHFSFGDTTTICEDPTYGYPFYLDAALLKALPPAWRSQSSYSNFADSGFSIGPSGPGGNVLNGGTDACGHSGIPSPAVAASAALHANAGTPAVGSWNRVVITGGIDQTNWGQVLTTIATNTAANKATYSSAAACASYIKSNWDGYSPGASSITTDTQQLLSLLQSPSSGDPSATITWQSYYNVAGSGQVFAFPAGVRVPSKLAKQPVVPQACQAGVAAALQQLNNLIVAGLNDPSEFVSIESSLDGHNNLIQPIFADVTVKPVQLFQPSGWPHPNSSGSLAIAKLLQP